MCVQADARGLKAGVGRLRRARVCVWCAVVVVWLGVNGSRMTMSFVLQQSYFRPASSREVPVNVRKRRRHLPGRYWQHGTSLTSTAFAYLRPSFASRSFTALSCAATSSACESAELLDLRLPELPELFELCELRLVSASGSASASGPRSRPTPITRRSRRVRLVVIIRDVTLARPVNVTNQQPTRDHR